ncbi:hypothetical protein WDW89_05305 [Deltaproteobacteria bacterium TL4]
MDEIIVGVSGINAVDNPGPGVGVARSLKEDPELNIKIVGLGYDAMEPGYYMDWLMDKPTSCLILPVALTLLLRGFCTLKNLMVWILCSQPWTRNFPLI